MRNVSQSFYGTLCAFSPVALLPFLLGNVEKYGSAGKTVAGGILTLGGILIGMELLLPAVLGYDRVAAEKLSGPASTGRRRSSGKCTGQI